MKMREKFRDQLKAYALQDAYRPFAPHIIVEKPASNLFDYAAGLLGGDRPLYYLEFGVAYGASLKHNISLYRNPKSRFIGFDSFDGLPEDWLTLKRGTFSTKGRPPFIPDERVSFVTGWFQNTVPDALRSLDIPDTHTTLIHFDSDLYSSTLFLLASLWAKIPNYYFVFNDFGHDEVVALNDFKSAFPVEIEFFAQTRGGGDPPNPDQVFGRLQRTVFSPAELVSEPAVPAHSKAG